MHISVERCGLDRKFILMNLYPLYLHDLAGIREVLPNRFGVFEDDDEVATLQEQQSEFDIWWQKEGLLYPYLILADGLPAGFALIASGPYTEGGSDYMVNEIFILRPYRGKGIGEAAFKELTALHPGSWSLFTTPGERNRGSIAFWRKTLARYAGDSVVEKDLELEHYGFSKLFLFSSAAADRSENRNEGEAQAWDTERADKRAAASVLGHAGSAGMIDSKESSDDMAAGVSAVNTAVRRASIADLPEIAALDARVVGHGGRLGQLEQHVASGCCLVCMREDRLQGFAAYDRSFFGYAFLQLIIVDPDGRRSGTGRRLMEAWEAELPGQKRFTSTNESNEPMRRLCQAMGYERSGVIQHLDEGDPEIIYCKLPVA